MAGLRDLLGRFSLTTRLVVAGTVVAVALWLGLDLRHSTRIEHMVLAGLTQSLEEEARADRLRFDSAVRSHHVFVRLMAREQAVIERGRQAVQLAGPARLFLDEPAWLPSRSDRRGFPLIDWVMFFDRDGTLHESHALLGQPLPAHAAEVGLRLLSMAEGQSHIANLGGIPCLLSAAPMEGTGAVIVILSRLDSRFMVQALGARGSREHVEALLAGGAVIASSSPGRPAIGTPLAEIQADWLVAGQNFFDYGSSEAALKFVTLFPRGFIQQQSEPLLSLERSQRTVLALALSTLFLAVLLMLAARLRAATRRVAEVTETVFGVPSQPERGDEVRALVCGVERLSEEVAASREALGREAAERLRMATTKLRVEAENERLLLLKAVTELTGVGVIRLTEDGPVGENAVMAQLEEEYGGLMPFLRAKAAGLTEVRMTAASGAPRTFTLTLASRVDPGLLLVRDVTDQRNGELLVRQAMEELERRVEERTRALVAAKDQAELASRAKTEFLAAVSHELRTPLNAIIGFSEVIADEMFGPLTGPAAYRDYAGDILSAGRHLLEVINDILDVARIEEGRMELAREEVAVPELARAALRLIEARALSRGVRLEEAIPPDITPLVGDRRRLLQILVNLLSNAVKFTPEGGTVRLSARRDDGAVVFAVSDTGIGMDDAQVRVALEPFRQVDGRIERKYEGTGLGLPLAKAFAELHGGGLVVASAPGSGTTVTVSIPARQGEDQLLAAD